MIEEGVPPTRASGPAWTSPEDGRDRGWPDGRYIVAFILDAHPTEDCRKATLGEARDRSYLLRQELIRKGHNGVRVVVWDAEDPERGDLLAEEMEELAPTRHGRPKRTT